MQRLVPKAGGQRQSDSDAAERLRAGWFAQVAGLPGVSERDPLRMFDGRGGATPAVFRGEIAEPHDAAALLRPGPQPQNAGLDPKYRDTVTDGESVTLTRGRLREIVGEAERVAREQAIHAKRLESHGGRLDTHDADLSAAAELLVKLLNGGGA